MTIETRKKATGRSSELPLDFRRMVSEILAANFDAGLKAVSAERGAESRFEIGGAIFPEEIVVTMSLIHGQQLAATTLYASVDFDPKASSPSIQDLLGACVDASGAFFSEFLDPKKPARIRQIADETLASLDGAPFEWTQLEIDRYRIFIKVDKANPSLDRLADDWLAKNDPDRERREREEQEATESLFVTGDKAKRDGGSGGTFH